MGAAAPAPACEDGYGRDASPVKASLCRRGCGVHAGDPPPGRGCPARAAAGRRVRYTVRCTGDAHYGTGIAHGDDILFLATAQVSPACVSYKGQNYRFVGGPKVTEKQKSQARKCAASLGVSGLGFLMGAIDPARGRKRASPRFSFLVAALFVLLAAWAAFGSVLYMAALPAVAALWAIQGAAAVRKARGPESRPMEGS